VARLEAQRRVWGVLGTSTAAKLKGKALAGSLPFQWQTDFDYSWMGGWLMNQDQPAERNVMMMIPGKDRGHAVIMADHDDTAYMCDRYDLLDGPAGRPGRSVCSLPDGWYYIAKETDFGNEVSAVITAWQPRASDTKSAETGTSLPSLPVRSPPGFVSPP
jgi:hypothetical protein